MPRHWRAAAAGILLAAMFPGAAGALRIVPGSFKVDPDQVDLTRTVTVSLLLEEESGKGGMLVSWMEPDLPHLVRLIESSKPWISCTVFEQSQGRWVYEAVAPGQVKFRFSASLYDCSAYRVSAATEGSAGARLNPPAIWSAIEVSPRILAPGERILLALSMRNDGRYSVKLRLPRAQVEMTTIQEEKIVEGPEGEKFDTTAQIREDRFELKPGESFRAEWSFLALAPGEVRFLVTGAGIVAMSPKARIRHAPALEFLFAAADDFGAVGKSYEFKGRLRSRGEVPVLDPSVFLSWSPSGAARLLSAPTPATGYVLTEGAEREIDFALDLLEAGTLVLTVTAQGRESDTGKAVAAQPEMRDITVLPPPELELELALESASVIVGSEAPFTLRVINRGSVMAASLSPSFTVRGGKAGFKPLTPLFQSIPAGASGVFRGGMVPEKEGDLELVAQVNSRGRLGGSMTVSVSQPARLLAVAAPVLELRCLTERVGPGAGKLDFLLRNAGKREFSLSRADLRLSGDGYSMQADLLAGKPLILSPGQETPVSVGIEPAAGADPYWLMAGLQFGGVTGLAGLEFAGSITQRPASLVCPAARRFVLVEPEGAFLPPLDPVLRIEWTLTAPGRSGLAVVTPAGEMVRKLVKLGETEAGWHGTNWYGENDKGRPVKPGNYILRLAGPPSGTPIWPAGAAWTVDRPIEVQAP